MATPGAAGVGALMLQANPNLSPFDIRNIMQDCNGAVPTWVQTNRVQRT